MQQATVQTHKSPTRGAVFSPPPAPIPSSPSLSISPSLLVLYSPPNNPGTASSSSNFRSPSTSPNASPLFPSSSGVSAASSAVLGAARLSHSCTRLQSLCQSRPDLYAAAVSGIDELCRSLSASDPAPAHPGTQDRVSPPLSFFVHIDSHSPTLQQKSQPQSQSQHPSQSQPEAQPQATQPHRRRSQSPHSCHSTSYTPAATITGVPPGTSPVYLGITPSQSLSSMSSTGTPPSARFSPEPQLVPDMNPPQGTATTNSITHKPPPPLLPPNLSSPSSGAGTGCRRHTKRTTSRPDVADPWAEFMLSNDDEDPPPSQSQSKPKASVSGMTPTQPMMNNTTTTGGASQPAHKTHSTTTVPNDEDQEEDDPELWGSLPPPPVLCNTRRTREGKDNASAHKSH